MELLVLLAVVLLGLSVLIRRSSRHAPAPPPAPAVALHTIADPAIAHRALVENAEAFSDRPVLPFVVNLMTHGGQRNENISTVPYGPHWRALRCNITAETLHPSRIGLRHLGPLQREAITNLITALQSATSSGAVVVREHLRTAVFRVITRLCFGDGVDEGHVRALCSQVHGMQVAFGGIRPPSPSGSSVLAKLAEWRYQRRLLAFHGRITELCLPLIAARRRRPHDDDDLCRPYVDSLIELRVPEGGGRRALRDSEMVDLVLEFLGAGTASSVVCLEWTLAHLVARPDIQQKLRREVDGGEAPDRSQLIRGMAYLHAVILESLRMHPPIPSALRQVHADAAALLVGGTPNSDLVALFLLGDMGRDNKTWKDPDEFRPERFLPGGEAESVGPLPGPKEMRMMPFGAGRRSCPGMGLAMMNMKCVLAALVHEFEWTPPSTDAAVDLTELDGFFKTMKKPLSARLVPRT